MSLTTKQLAILSEIADITRDLDGDLDNAERAELATELDLAKAEAKGMGVPAHLL